MNTFQMTRLGAALAAGLLAMGAAHAQYGGGGGGGGGGGAAPAEASTARNVTDLNNRPLYDGSYGAVLGQYRISESDPVLDAGPGISALLGYRNKVYGLEAGFGFSEEDGVKLGHFIFNVLAYPFESIPFLYGLVGVGASRYQDYPFERSSRPVEGNRGFNTGNLQGGIGYILPLKWNDYEYGLRIEALYRYSDRFIERESDNIADIFAPSTFKDTLINVGLHMPLRKPLPPLPEPEPEPVRVAPVADSDNDGVADNADQCPDTPFGTDVDAVGCPLPPPVAACGEAMTGSMASLEGCDVGDSIVLRGVNFDTNQSRLEVNARTLLDDVARDLKRYPDVNVQISGHTDSQGSASYNQRLSEQRAQSVMRYLTGQGVAASRMTAVGAGLERPIADNDTAEGREQNRRVELTVTSGTTARDGRATASSELDASDEAESEETPAPAAAAPAQADNAASTGEDTSSGYASEPESSSTDEDLDALFDF